MEATEVAVIGAGMAGLICAQALEEAGLHVTVLERSQRIGGRVGTDRVDGFRCDRGFQMINTAYPALQRHVDVTALNVQGFQLLMVLAHPDGYRVLGDPRRGDAIFYASLRSGLSTPRDIARMLRWSDPIRRPIARLLGASDLTLGMSYEKHQLEGPLLEEVLKPYFAFLLGDDDGSTSYQFAMLADRMFSRGNPGLPALGMQALPDQLAFGLEEPVTLGVEVQDVRRIDEGIRVSTDQGEFSARAVVVATDPTQAAKLVGIGSPIMRGQTTWWFAAPESPTSMKTIFVDPMAPASGLLSHTAVVSNVAPRYAPTGQHLIQATAPHSRPGACDDDSEQDVRRHLEAIYRTSTSTWQLVTRHVIAEALPITPPPLITRRDVDFGDGLFVAGDHRDTASIQGAIVSGRRTARAVLDHLNDE